VDDTPDRAKQRETELSETVDEDTTRGTKGRVYRGERERLKDALILRLLRAEGYSPEQIAAFEAKLHEHFAGARRA
jgi:hypothetical protein